MSFLKIINGTDFIRGVKAGCLYLEQKRDEVDSLNVFPVPDGDTGTNMYLTLISAVKEGEKRSSDTVEHAAKAISIGSLMGARGNSGVILSQIFRGMAQGLSNKKTADADDIAKALQQGAKTAYKAVMKPVEGTILTIIREVAKSAMQITQKQNEDIISVLLESIRVGYTALDRTPEMLPVLKEAGVVDSGGQGLLFFLEGFVSGLAAENNIELNLYPASKPDNTRNVEIEADINLDFQYCTEVLIKGDNLVAERVKNHLISLGDSVLVVGGDDIIKVHIHSNHPGRVLETCLRFGDLSDIKINNMLEEIHEHRHTFNEKDTSTNNITAALPPKKLGMVAVASGAGIAELLTSLGVDEIVTGGQTMNPSTQDILAAINKIDAENIIVLPNNSNIIMAAEQTRHLSNKKIEVIPTKSVMQAITILIEFDPHGELEDVTRLMKDSMGYVSYAEITASVRDASLNGLNINNGDWLGILDGEIFACGPDMKAVIQQILKEIINENNEIITILYGEDITLEEAQTLEEYIKNKFPKHEVELHYGGQAHYPYLLSAE